MDLDQIVQLHESIHIFYSVEPMYTARLDIRDGAKTVLQASGDTPQEALANLATLAKEQIQTRYWKR